MTAPCFPCGLGAVAAASRPTHGAQEIADALRAVGCLADGTYPSRTACIVRAVTGFAGQIDAVASQASATGASLGKSLSPVTSKDPDIAAAQRALRSTEAALSSSMIGIAPQLRAAARDLRALARVIAETMAKAAEGFGQLAEARDAADAAGAAELDALMVEARDWIRAYFDDQVIRVFDLGLFYAELAARLQSASAALVDYRFEDLEGRSVALASALDGWKKTLDDWQRTIDIMNPIAGIGRGALMLPGAIGAAIGQGAGGAIGEFAKKVWPFAVGGFVLWRVLPEKKAA